MNRQQFLTTCGAGLCACVGLPAATSIASTLAPPSPPADWRLPWAQRRYARLLEILAAQTNDETVAAVLNQVGRFCASQMKLLGQHAGDVDGFIREFSQRYHEEITFDRDRNVITVVSAERTDCTCPLICRQTPGSACACSLGWQKHVYETLLGREVRVELKESVLRGGRRCVFAIQVLGPVKGEGARSGS